MNPTQQQLDARVQATGQKPVPQTPTISANTLTSTPTPLNIPNLQEETPAPFQPSITTQQYGAQAAQSLADLDKTVNQLGQQPVRKQQLEQEVGIPAINQRIQELSAIDAQYGADLSNISSQELQQNVAGDLATNYAPLRDAVSTRNTRANIQRQQNVNIKRATNAAAIAAANGQLALANDYVTRALDYEFKPLEAQLQFKTLLYQENKDLFTKAEQRDFDAALKKEEREYEKQKTDKQQRLELLTQIAQNGEVPNSVLTKLSSATSADEAFKIAAPYLATTDNQIVNLENGATVVVDKRTGKVISNLGGTKPNVSYAPSEGNPVGLSPLAQTIYNSPRQYHDLTPSDKADVLTEIASKVPNWNPPKKLGAEQEKAVSLAEAGLLALQQLEGQIYNEDGTLNRSALAWSAVPIIGSFTQTGTAQRATIDPISRLRTGAAMTPSEEKYYSQQVPRSVDSPELVEQKTASLKAFYSGIAGNPVTLISPEGQAIRYEDMFDPRQRLEVRKAMEAGYKFIDY